MSSHLLNVVGLSREQVANLTKPMKPVQVLVAETRMQQPEQPHKTYYQPPSNIEVRDAIEVCLRQHSEEWLDSDRIASAIGTNARLAGNILAGMVRAGMHLEKRIGEQRRPEYRWIGGWE